MNNNQVNELSLIEILKMQCMLSEKNGKETIFVDSKPIIQEKQKKL